MRKKPCICGILNVIGVFMALWVVLSCSSARRTAESSHFTDRSFIRKDSLMAAAWKDSVFRDQGISIRLLQATITDAVVDSSGRVITPRSTTLTELSAVRNNIETSIKDSVAVSVVQDTIRKDISEDYQQTPLPVERNAMWRFFTVLVVLGTGAAVFFWVRKRRLF